MGKLGFPLIHTFIGSDRKALQEFTNSFNLINEFHPFITALMEFIMKSS